MPEVLSALRRALAERLRGDAALVALVGGGDRIVRRPSVLPPVRPLVTFFEFGTRPDPTAPLLDWTVQLDVWARDVEEAEPIAQRLGELLDQRPLSADGVLRGMVCQLVADRDEVVEDGDLARRTQEYRLLGYDLLGRRG